MVNQCHRIAVDCTRTSYSVRMCLNCINLLQHVNKLSTKICMYYVLKMNFYHRIPMISRQFNIGWYFGSWFVHSIFLLLCICAPFHFMNNYFINTSINKSILAQHSHEHFILSEHILLVNGEIVCVFIRFKANSLVFIYAIICPHIFTLHVSQRMLSGHRSKWENFILFRIYIPTSYYGANRRVMVTQAEEIRGSFWLRCTLHTASVCRRLHDA